MISDDSIKGLVQDISSHGMYDASVKDSSDPICTKDVSRGNTVHDLYHVSAGPSGRGSPIPRRITFRVSTVTAKLTTVS